MPIADRQDSQSTAKTVEAPLRQSQPSIRLFISYAHRDEDLRLELDDHLSNLQRQRIISGWHDRRIAPGQEWADQIDNALNEAQIILLLISARFMASDYCYAKEMVRAIERHDAGEAVVIPIILSACDWKDAPFSKLQALPKDAKPIKNWNDRDEAWVDVVRGLRRVIDSLPRPVPTVETPSVGGNPSASASHPTTLFLSAVAAAAYLSGETERTLSGNVVDKDTRRPFPFANVTFADGMADTNGQGPGHASPDDDGYTDSRSNASAPQSGSYSHQAASLARRHTPSAVCALVSLALVTPQADCAKATNQRDAAIATTPIGARRLEAF